MRRDITRICVALLGVTSFVWFNGPAARADSPVWALGRVLDSAGRPVPNALVAVYDDHNRVEDYAHTDKNGNYALSIKPEMLHLPRSGGGGFLAQVFGTVGHLVGGVADFVSNPLRAGLHAAAGTVAATMVDPLSRGGIAAASVVLDQTLFAVTDPHPPKPEQARKEPGALLVKAVANNRNGLVAVARVYWMQDNVFELDGQTHKTRLAWVDPLELTSYNSSANSRVEGHYLTFSSARLEPALAERGQPITISAVLDTPPAPDTSIIVAARDARTGKIWQLHKQHGVYEATFTIDKSFPNNDQVISVIAYPASQQSPGRRKDTEAAILRSGLWNPAKLFVYNPLLVASRNRADLTLTVLSVHPNG